MAAPKGNQYATKGRVWSQAIERALAARSKRDGIVALDLLAEKLLALADEGELGALKELGDRLEGKSVQPSEIEMTAEVSLREIKHVIVKPGD